MRVKEVRIKDFKCLKDFNASLDGHNVILLGDNEVGKSSLIQFIKICIGDKSCIPPGLSGGGELTMDMDGKDVKFILKLKDGKPNITVRGDGISIDDNKGAIASLIGAIKFNPETFISLSETDAGRKKQVDDFKETFIDPEIRLGLAKHEANAKNYYAERTEVNKEVTKLEGAVKANPMYNHIHELEKFQPVDVSAVIAERDKAQKNNANIDHVKREIELCDKDIANYRKEIADLQSKIDAYNATIDLCIQKINDGNKWLTEKQPIDTAQFDVQINSATETNKKASDAQNLKNQLQEIEKLKTESGELTVMIDSAKQAIKDTITQLDSTVPGLGFDEDQLVYNGIPVHPNTMSTSQRSQLAVILKRAENPNLPILLECSESWGQKKFDWLKELSETNNFQFIAERVESGTEKLEIRILADEVAH